MIQTLEIATKKSRLRLKPTEPPESDPSRKAPPAAHPEHLLRHEHTLQQLLADLFALVHTDGIQQQFLFSPQETIAIDQLLEAYVPQMPSASRFNIEFRQNEPGTALANTNCYYTADIPPYLYSHPTPDGTQYAAYFYVSLIPNQDQITPTYQISFEIHDQSIARSQNPTPR